MRIFSVSYGIKTETDIEKLLRFLRKIKNEYDWHHPIETVWFVKSDKSAEEIFHDLYEPGTFEGFIVTEIKPECIKGWTSNQFWLWLKNVGELNVKQDILDGSQLAEEHKYIIEKLKQI